MKYFIAAIAWLLSTSTFASSSLCNSSDSDCVNTSQWQFSVAIGIGELTNPLAGGDNIPLFVIPYVSYYRDRFFLENTTLGFTLLDKPKFDLSFIVEPNSEQAFFEQFHLRNIIAPGSYVATDGNIVDSPDGALEIPDDVTPPIEQREVTVDDIANRKWAIDSGLLGHWYINDSSKLSMQWLHDVSGVYRGHHAKVTYHYEFRAISKLPVNVRLIAGVHWKENALVDYYYGLRSSDEIDEQLYYQGRSVLNPFLGATLQYKLTDDWQLKASVKRQFLGAGITDSPLIRKDDVNYFFIGGVYAF
ncbi:MipA/OmpV family protein [Pseudoalteromonas aurantia]|uniref:Outer membrane protein n=1 Tax=Pseudoalteromonas aurantia 208 TaxID=1314867 RepID=A0ABR9EH83_9GAMM|nr:MipA/OmpV family protein [Pseudoalteromonas aurantia]MBE0370192.1 outer membrane protein [Pseudoalteromonas aurantia 208]